MQDANFCIGKLKAYSDLIPDIDFFIQMYAIKEATKSNRIEGTKTTFDEAVSSQDNISPERVYDWQEVQNYILALNSTIQGLEKLPLSIRLLKDSHNILMQGVRGKNKCPGEVNWIGCKMLILYHQSQPDLPELLTDLEKFLHNDNLLIPNLIKAGIAHYQFETIHPFLDGNGRVGRLLIILYLVERKMLNKPVLYISDFFEKHRSSYYDALSLVKTSNNLEQWLKSFLKGVIDTAQSSISTFNKLTELRKDCEVKIKSIRHKSQRRFEFLNLLYSKPTLSVKDVCKAFDISVPASNKLVKDFVEVGILKEKTGFKRNRYFVFADYLNIFRE
ncbi:MAG: Fic/DOC family N-terminal domain-containing protein [bacterium]